MYFSSMNSSGAQIICSKTDRSELRLSYPLDMETSRFRDATGPNLQTCRVSQFLSDSCLTLDFSLVHPVDTSEN